MENEINYTFMAEPLVIKNFETGIANSANSGHGLIKNATVDLDETALRPNLVPTSLTATGSSTFTANAGTDIITVTNTTTFSGNYANSTAVAVTVSNSGGALPTGLTAATVYFVITVDANTGTLKLATTKANAEAGTNIDITGNGSGTNTITVVPMGTPTHSVTDKNNITYVLDSNGRVWFNGGATTTLYVLLIGNTLTNTSGNGLVAFTNSDATATYLFVFRDTNLDVCNVTNATKRDDPVGQTAWTNSWKLLNAASGSGNSHHAIIGQDNIIYFADNRFIGSIMEKAGSVFDPATAGTFTYNNQALDMPQGEIIQCLEELGKNLLGGGLNTNLIYPWDRSSSSFSLPLRCAEKGIYKMKNINNSVYILAGQRGWIRRTNGSYIEDIRQVPEYLTGYGGVTWGGIGVSRGHLIFGVGCVTTANQGILRLTPEGILTIDVQPTTGGAKVTMINDTYVAGDNVMFGSAGEVANLANTNYSNTTLVYQSQLFRVGTKKKPAEFSELEAQFSIAATSGTLRISYRTNLSDAFTVINTFTLSSATVTSYAADAGLTDIENIQIQVEISGGGVTVDTARLLEIRLMP